MKIDPVHRVTLLLTACFTLSYTDRHLLGLLAEPIKHSLLLSDTQIGLLQGLSFSIFYVLASVPLARLADHGHRPRIMSACVTFWCLMTLAMSAAGNFWHLMLARVGLASAEAGLPPAAMTLMTDLNQPHHLARANAFFMLSPFVGGGIALTAGGALYAWAQTHALRLPWMPAHAEPWRTVFVLVGAPGVLAAGALLLLAEPRPRRTPSNVGHTLRTVKAYLRGDAGIFPAFMLAMAMMALLLNGTVAWVPALLMRLHALSPREAGVVFGPVFTGAGVLGTLSAGWIVARRQTGILLRVFRYMRGCALVALLPAIAAPLVPDLRVTLALLALTIFCTSSVLALSSVPLLLTAPRSVRAQVLAIQAIIAALAGTGLGPMLVGALSDATQSLGGALAAVGAAAVLVAAASLSYVAPRAAAASARVDPTSTSAPANPMSAQT